MNNEIEHEGIISRIDKEKIRVSIMQNSACAGCHAKSMCQFSESKEKIIEIFSVDSSFHEGDKICVVGNSSSGLQAVLYAFVIPLVLIVTILVFYLSYFDSETLAALVAIIALVAYFFILYAFREKFKKKFVFKIKEIKGN